MIVTSLLMVMLSPIKTTSSSQKSLRGEDSNIFRILP
ncbi:hypothetical protein CASFOL_033756 [Castilleja foliolosa]|uniref:Uncharacterized protein n=1 Tax=Castilleja foliolosa TaxID=1961234 RepID=A0ABD3C0B7_9LAMI